MKNTFTESFLNPSKEFSPIPFWFWNDTLNKEKIKDQIISMKSHGIDGFVIHPRIGLPDNLLYMSEEFLDYVKFAVQTAKENDMNVVLYDEGMYPSGSANGLVVKSNPEFANKCLIKKEKSASLTVEAPPLAEGEKYICAVAVKEKDGAIEKCREIHIGDSFKEDLGQWKFFYFIMTYSKSTIRGIHFSEDDGEENAPLAADLMNIEATKAFIENTHEKYYSCLKEYFGNTIMAIFTDEPSPEARGALENSIPWTDDFLTYFKAEMSVEDLPVLWCKSSKDYEKTYKKYRDIVNSLMGKRFFAPISKWCKDHNIALTGHPGKSNDIGHLKHFQIPCQDVVWRYIEPGDDNALTGDHSTMGKCSSDSARHRGMRRNGNEVLGCCGPKENGWLMTLSDVKWYFDWLFARGVNLIYPHAFFYSVEKPRYDERPPDVGFNSYWWAEYNTISTYIKRMCFLLTDSINVCNTAFLCGPHDLPYIYPRAFFENQCEFNYLEKELLETAATVTDGTVRIQKQCYLNIVVESKDLLTPQTTDILKKFADGGGRVFTAFESDEFIYCPTPDALVEHIDKTLEIYPADKDLRATAYIKNGHKFITLFNEGNRRICGELSVPNAGKISILNPVNGEIKAFENGFIALNPRESRVLYIETDKKEVSLSNWTVDSENKNLTDWMKWVGYENHCGYLYYTTEFILDDFSNVSIEFERICEMGVLRCNESPNISLMLPPFECDITEYVKKGKNSVSVRVYNSTAMRFTDSKPESGIIGNVKLNII